MPFGQPGKLRQRCRIFQLMLACTVRAYWGHLFGVSFVAFIAQVVGQFIDVWVERQRVTVGRTGTAGSPGKASVMARLNNNPFMLP